MKNQALFSSKDKSKKLKCRLLQFLFGPLTVKSLKVGFAFTTYTIFLMATTCQTELLEIISFL